MPASLSGLGVLVVDDNGHVQAIWRAILSAADAWYFGASDTPTAMEMLSHHPIHIIVVDYRLGDGDRTGDELIASLRYAADPEGASLAILACTSDDSPAAMSRLEDAGADAILPKPIVPSEALLQLGALNRRRRARPIQRSASRTP